MKISEGFSNRKIDKWLHLSEKTVKNYDTSVFRKIDVEDGVHVAITAIQNNIVNYYKLRFGENVHISA
jgi:two-component system, NarL family, response regulator DegU